MSRHQAILLALAILTVPLIFLFTPAKEDAPLHSLAGATLSDFDGNKFRLSSLMASKKIMLAFWSITCADCVTEIPFLITMHQKLGQRVTIVGLHPPGYPKKRIQAFFKRFPHKIPYLLAVDEDLFLTRTYEATVQPKLVLLDERGRELWSHVGYKEEENAALEKEIRAHL